MGALARPAWEPRAALADELHSTRVHWRRCEAATDKLAVTVTIRHNGRGLFLCLLLLCSSTCSFFFFPEIDGGLFSRLVLNGPRNASPWPAGGVEDADEGSVAPRTQRGCGVLGVRHGEDGSRMSGKPGRSTALTSADLASGF